MLTTKTAAFFIAIGMFLLMSQDSKGLPTNDLGGGQIAGVNLTNVTAINAFTRLLNAAHVPGGIVTITTCGPEQSRDLMPLGPTLHDALDSIIVANPQYRWYLDHDAVNLIPINDGPTLLDVVIADFQVERGQTLDDIVQKLLALPEAKEGAIRLHLTQGFTEIGIRSLTRPGFSQSEENRRLMLHLRNATIREALNALARAHGTAVWAYQERRCNGPQEFSIRFLIQ